MNKIVLDSGKELPKNASSRAIYIDCSKTATVEFSKTTVTIDKQYNINIGDKIEYEFKQINGDVYKTYYIAKEMEIVKDNLVISETKVNDSTVYVTPMLELNRKFMLYEHCLFNCYSDTLEYDKKWGLVYLTYRFIPFTFYLEFEDLVKNNKNFVKKIKNNDSRFETFIFKIPARFEQDYFMFQESNFKGFTKEYIETAIIFHSLSKKDKMYKIITNSSEYRKEMSIMLGCDIPENVSLKSKINKDRETLKL